ncbi:MAG: O-antigen ligase family protein [Candidatus Limnocylindrales bacterium]
MWRLEDLIARGPINIGLLLAAPLLAGVLVAVASLTTLAFVGAAVAVGLVVTASAVSPRAAVTLVFTASMFGGLTVQTPVGLLRMDQAIVLPALSGVLLRWVSDRDRSLVSGGRAPLLLTVGLGLYLLANLFSTLLMAIDVASSLRVVLWLSLSFAAYILTIAVAGRYCSVGTLLDDVVAIGTAASAAAVVLYGLAGLGISSFGVVLVPYTAGLSAKGTFFEANLLGGFAAMTALLATSQLLHARGHKRRRRALLLLCVGMCVTAAYLSFTRAAWLGLAVGGLVVLLLSRPPSGRAQIVVRGGLVVASTVVLLLLTGLGTPLLDRVLSLFTDSTGTIAFRSSSYAQALSGIPLDLWFGLGTNSFGQHFLDPAQYDGRAYLAGLFIATMWDVGLVGMALLLVSFVTLAKTMRQALAGVDHTARAQAVGFSAAFVCALVAYQATNGFWFAYNWILIGLAASIPVVHAGGVGWLRSNGSLRTSA